MQTKTSTKTTKKTFAAKPAEEDLAAAAAASTAAAATTADASTATEAGATEAGTAADTGASSVAQRIEELIKGRQEQLDGIKREIAGLKKLLRDYNHELKEASKRGKKKKVPRDNSKPRKPSGFAEPVVVSGDLYAFLGQFGVKKGSPVARTEVTKHVIEYIKQKNLQNPERRREIIPDQPLGKLFGPAFERRDPEDESSPMVYSYLKLQRYLTPHFPSKKNGGVVA